MTEMILARTPDGYKPTKDIKKGDILLNHGEWIKAESDSVLNKGYKFEFKNGSYTFSKHVYSICESCNIILPFTESHLADKAKGYVIQKNIKFPFRSIDQDVIPMMTALTKSLPPTYRNAYDFRLQEPITYTYSNNEINDIANGLLFQNVNNYTYREAFVRFRRKLSQEGIMFLRLASITANTDEVYVYSFYNLISIMYSFNPTRQVYAKAFRYELDDYSDDNIIMKRYPFEFYDLPKQDFDINNFSTI